MLGTIVTVEMQFSVSEDQVSDMIITDGFLDSESVQVIDSNGAELDIELIQSKLNKIELVDEDGDTTSLIYSKLPQVSYFAIENKSFEFDDMLYIDKLGTFSMVVMGEIVFLYDPKTNESIILESSNLQCIKKELLEKYPTYIVLKKKVTQ